MQMEDYLYQKDLYLPLGRKEKIADDYEGWRMGVSWQKGTRNNTVVPGFVGALQYFERKNNKGCDERIGELYEKPSASNKVFLIKHFFNMKMSEGQFVVDYLKEFNPLLVS